MITFGKRQIGVAWGVNTEKLAHCITFNYNIPIFRMALHSYSGCVPVIQIVFFWVDHLLFDLFDSC